MIIALIENRNLRVYNYFRYNSFGIHLSIDRSSDLAIRAMQRALSNVGKCKSNPLLRKTDRERKEY